MTLKEKVVNSIVKFRTSFIYLYAFIALIFLWIGLNASGLVHWDNPEFTYLNIAISVLTELQSVVLLIYVTKIDAHNKIQAEADHENIAVLKSKLIELNDKLEDHLNRLRD